MNEDERRESEVEAEIEIEMEILWKDFLMSSIELDNWRHMIACFCAFFTRRRSCIARGKRGHPRSTFLSSVWI